MNEGPTSSEELEEFARENFFSSEEFLENRTSIVATVALLLRNPKSRSRFELASIYTVKGGELLARILRTPHGLVIVHDGWFPEGMWETHVAPNARSGYLVDVPPDVADVRHQCAIALSQSGPVLAECAAWLPGLPSCKGGTVAFQK